MVEVDKLSMNLEMLKARVIKIYVREYGRLVIEVLRNLLRRSCFIILFLFPPQISFKFEV